MHYTKNKTRYEDVFVSFLEEIESTSKLQPISAYGYGA